MSLDHSTPSTDRSAVVPNAFDAKLLAFVLSIAILSASVNVAYGGFPFAIAAFAVLSIGGIGAHALGQRRLRRVTTDLVEQWIESGGHIEAVTQSSWGRTGWTVQTGDGDIFIGGVPLEPLTRLSVEWNGITETKPIPKTEEELDALAGEWYREIFDGG